MWLDNAHAPAGPVAATVMARQDSARKLLVSLERAADPDAGERDSALAALLSNSLRAAPPTGD